MANKHYDVSYLQDTFKLLNELKQSSYQRFTALDSGIVLDLGCGAGTDVIEMSKTLKQGVKVIGVDHDPVMVEQGRSSIEGQANIEFVLSEAYPLPFQDSSVSGLRTERMIQHLTNPESVFQDINRILIPGSPVVIIETDWHSLSFYTPHTEIQKSLNAYLTDRKVNNGFAARKVTQYLLDNDFEGLNFKIHPLVVDSLDVANAIFFIDKIVREASEHNYISKQQEELFLQSLDQAGDQGFFACSINLVLVSANKKY